MEDAKEGHRTDCRTVPLWKAYRCFYCGFFFCPACAQAHFENANERESRRPEPPRREAEQMDAATRDIIGKAEATMNMAASFLSGSDEAGDASARHHRQRLQIAAGALSRLLALTPAKGKEK
jgi:hypothetical protein